MVPKEVKEFVNEINKKKGILEEYTIQLNDTRTEFETYCNYILIMELINPFLKVLFKKHVPSGEWRSDRGDLFKLIDDGLQVRPYRCHGFNSLRLLDYSNKLNSNIVCFLKTFELDFLLILNEFIETYKDIVVLKNIDEEIIITKTLKKPIEYISTRWSGMEIKKITEYTFSIPITKKQYSKFGSVVKFEYESSHRAPDSDHECIYIDNDYFELHKFVYEKAIEYFHALIKDAKQIKNNALNVIMKSEYAPDFLALQI